MMVSLRRDRFVAEMRDLALSHQQIEDLLDEIQAEVRL